MADIGRVVPLIMDRPMCLDCIAAFCGMNPGDVELALDKIAVVLVLRTERRALCRGCTMKARVHSVQRGRLPAASAAPA